MTAASMNVNVVRGMVSTWPGRILVIVLAAVLVGGAVMIFRGNTGTAPVTYRTAEAATREHRADGRDLRIGQSIRTGATQLPKQRSSLRRSS